MYGLDPNEEYVESLQNTQRKCFAISQAQQGDLVGAKQTADLINLNEERDEALVAIVALEAQQSQFKLAKETVQTISFAWHQIAALCAIACVEVTSNRPAAEQTLRTAQTLLPAIKHECYRVIAAKTIFLAQKEMALTIALEQSRALILTHLQTLERVRQNISQSNQWLLPTLMPVAAVEVGWEQVRR